MLADMVAYRRHRVPGGTYFFTVTLADRRAASLLRYRAELGESIRAVQALHPFASVAMVLLPEHLHTIWRLPEGDDRYPMRWRLIKRGFTDRLRNDPEIASAAVGESRWARRYWEHTIRDDEDLMRHIDYVHFNPVKHGLVERVADWPYSSFHRFVRNGWRASDWGADASFGAMGAGE
jgi:putative transposase